MYKKLFFLAALVAILATAALPGSPAFASSTRVVGFASVDKVSVVSDQPASFRLRGTYTCDKVQVSSSVNGKVIDITINNVKIVGGGNKCQTKQAFNRIVNVGILVPGKYTVYVNRASTGVAQKKFTFIAPLIATVEPVHP
jgi:hypothetical protein